MAEYGKIDVLARVFGDGASRREVTRMAAGALLGAVGLSRCW